MRIAVLGAGYVGLVSGACLADFGHHVTCVDKDSIKISTLKAGKVPIYEPGLDEIVLSNVQQGRLSFTVELAHALRGRMQCSSPSAPRHVVATAMLISRMSTRQPEKSLWA